MKFLAIFLTLLVVSPELVIAAENLPYPVRELLRRTADRPEKVAQMATEYQREAEVAGYTGPINGGDEAKGLAISMLNSLEVARAPMGHSKIIEIVTSLNKTLAVIAAVDKKYLLQLRRRLIMPNKTCNQKLYLTLLERR